MLLAFLMLALVSWQSATSAADSTPPRPRTLALIGMVVGIVGSILSHYIGALEVGIPLLFGETVRLYHRRRPDWPLLATALSAIPAIALVMPMMRRTHDVVIVHSPFLTPPITLHKIAGYWNFAATSWPDLISTELIEVLGLVIFVTWAPRLLNRSYKPPALRDGHPIGIPSHIISACLGALF